MLVVKDAQRRFTASPEDAKFDFKSWLKTNLTRPRSAWGDPSRHTAETLRKFVDTLGEKYVAAVASLAACDKWKKKREQWDAWDEEEAAGTSEDSRWALVRRTRRNESFKDAYYSLPSHEAGWKRTKYRPIRWCKEKDLKPRLLGVDCEMCETDQDKRALCGVSVVDEDGKVLLKTLVKPPGKIIDLKKEITGLEENDVLKSKTTLRDVQDKITALCKPGTVLVGHSLNYDLRALKIDHQPVIDSALLFRYRGLPRATPSLARLCEVMLGKKMRQGEGGFHDSVEDAQAALDVVLLESRQTEPTHEIDPPAMEIDEKDLCKLFVHRIPRGTSKDRIKAIFKPDDQAHIVSVEGEFLGDAGRTAEAIRDKKTTACFVTFDGSKSADGAFDRIDTPALNVDAMNRPQKFIEIDSDAVKPSPGKNPRVVVRKMNSTAGGVKRARPSHPNASSTPKEKKKKRQRKPKIPLPGDK